MHSRSVPASTQRGTLMQRIRVRSRVGSDSNLLKLPEQLANQEIDVILVYQSVEPNE